MKLNHSWSTMMFNSAMATARHRWTAKDAFARLGAAELEPVAPGRWGGVAVRLAAGTGASEVPLVRSTTVYHRPPRLFGLWLDALLPEEVGNNALLEVYDDRYRTMGFHSDQAQDLADGSEISIYSFYRDPARADRRLVVQCKATRAVVRDIPLVHGGVVRFTTETNGAFRHRIELAGDGSGNQWLGVTARTAKTFVRFDDADSPPRIICVDDDATLLRLATEPEARELYRRRSEENRACGAYPWPADVDYTISPSDLMLPTS